jgi:hypothetical protein
MRIGLSIAVVPCFLWAPVAKPESIRDDATQVAGDT